MKDALIIGAGAVGVYLAWKWFKGTATVPAADASATSAAGAAASSMTASGATATTYGGLQTPGLLPPLPSGNMTRQGALSTPSSLAARDALMIATQTRKADAAPEPAAPAPAWTGIPVLTIKPVVGTLPAGDQGGGYTTPSKFPSLASLVRR